MRIITDWLGKKEGSAWCDLILLAAVFAVAFFLFLGRAPLLIPDEARYSEVPREMLERGDFITPHLNYVDYFEKPPLYYWLNAFSFRILGETEFAARFFSALLGLGGVLLTYCIGRAAWGRREGLLSSLVLGTSLGYLVQGRLAITDMTLTFFMTGALGLFFMAARAGEPRAGWFYYLSYACAALAVLTKGPVGALLPGSVVVLYLLIGRRGHLLREMRPVKGFALCALIAVPWFVLVSIRNPGFPGFFFITQHLERFFTTNLKRHEPFLFFVPVLLGGMFPWSCFFPSAVAQAWRGRKSGESDPGLFMLLWAAVIFLFFTLSGSKLTPYILPMFPAAALLTGRAFSRVFDEGITVVRRQAHFASSALLAGAAGIALWGALMPDPRISRVGCAVIGIILLCAGILCFLTARRGHAVRYFFSLVLMFYIAEIAGTGFVIRAFERKRSLKELALIVRDRAGAGNTVFSYCFYAQDFPFYMKRRIAVVGAEDELAYGRSQQGRRNPWFIKFRTFFRLWDSQGPLFAVIDRDDIPLLEKSVRTPVRVLGVQGEKELITNR